jgi:hypothetical protein
MKQLFEISEIQQSLSMQEIVDWGYNSQTLYWNVVIRKVVKILVWFMYGRLGIDLD